MNHADILGRARTWTGILGIAILMIVCLAGPAAAALMQPDAHCAGAECQAALRCADGSAAVASAPTPTRTQVPAALVAPVADVPRLDRVPLVAESPGLALVAQSLAPLAPRSPPSLL